MIAYGFLLLASALVAALPSAPSVRVDQPKVTLPFVGKLNVTGHTIAEVDRARAAHNLARSKGSTEKRQSFSITNQVVDYVATGQFSMKSSKPTATLLFSQLALAVRLENIFSIMECIVIVSSWYELILTGNSYQHPSRSKLSQ